MDPIEATGMDGGLKTSSTCSRTRHHYCSVSTHHSANTKRHWFSIRYFADECRPTCGRSAIEVLNNDLEDASWKVNDSEENKAASDEDQDQDRNENENENEEDEDEDEEDEEEDEEDEEEEVGCQKPKFKQNCQAPEATSYKYELVCSQCKTAD